MDDDILKEGSSGNRVADLQRWLKRRGLFAGTVSGAYDAETATAVRAFRADVGLAPGDYDSAASAARKCVEQTPTANLREWLDHALRRHTHHIDVFQTALDEQYEAFDRAHRQALDALIAQTITELQEFNSHIQQFQAGNYEAVRGSGDDSGHGSPGNAAPGPGEGRAGTSRFREEIGHMEAFSPQILKAGQEALRFAEREPPDLVQKQDVLELLEAGFYSTTAMLQAFEETGFTAVENEEAVLLSKLGTIKRARELVGRLERQRQDWLDRHEASLESERGLLRGVLALIREWEEIGCRTAGPATPSNS